MTDSPIDALARALADGQSPDWSAAESAAATEHDRRLVRRLRRIETIATHARTATPWIDAPAHVLSPGSIWGRLRILGTLGAGTYGVVYRAFDPSLDREVALKVMKPRAARSSTATAVEEGRLLARVQHPNVVSVYGADCVDDHVGIWMELIHGQTLEEMLHASGPIDAEQATRIGIDLCRALEAVHRSGLVHGDVKAANVIRGDDGRVVLMDFGAGREHAQAPNLEHLTGTPAYLAPEVLDGATSSAQSDCYSAGVVIYRLLTGAYPVSAQSLADLRRLHSDKARTRLVDARPAVKARLARAVDRALAQEPSARQATAAEFAADLEASLRTPVWRQPATIGLGVAAIVVAIGTVWGILSWSLHTRGPGDGLQVPQQVMGRPSLDGRLFSFVDGYGGLHTWNAVTGESRAVSQALVTGEVSGYSAISAGADAVAYNVWRTDRAWELRILALPNGAPKAVIPRETAFNPIPMDWSRDGRQILCTFDERDGSKDLALVPVDGSTPKIIATFRTPIWNAASLSPDGRYVAVFDREAHLSILGIDGRVRTSLDRHGERPFWTPDGRHILFAGPSPGNRDRAHWIASVTDGVVGGDPTVTTVPRAFALQAIAPDGRLVATETIFRKEIYIAPFDPTGSPAVGPPSRASPTRIGDHVGPSWSDDSRLLAFMDISGPARRLVTRDVSTGVEQIVPPTAQSIGGRSVQWMPDRRSVVVYVFEPHDQIGFYRVNLATGQAQPLVLTPQSSHNNFQVTEKGRRLVYFDQANRLVSRNLETGGENPVASVAIPEPFAISPGGQSVAFIDSRTDGGRRLQSIEVWTAGDGLHRILDWPSGRARLQTWTPSGDILFTVSRTTEQRSVDAQELMMISPRDGQPRDLGFSFVFDGANTVAVSPDGKRLAYTETSNRTTLHVLAQGLQPDPPGK